VFLFNRLTGAAIGLALFAAPQAFADDDPEHNLTIGLGLGLTSEYEGSDSFQVFPVVPLTYEHRFVKIRTIGLGLEADISQSDYFDAGPVFRYRFARDNDVDNRQVALLPEVDASLEIGGFFRTGLPLKMVGFDDPTIIFAQVSAMQDVIGGHGGFVVEGRAGVLRPMTEKLTAILSGSTTYGSGAFMDSYFDVTAAGAAASGLAAFDAESGLKDVGATAILDYKFNEKWSTTVLGSYSRLIGDAADSPIVSTAGSPNQFTVGFALNYKLF